MPGKTASKSVESDFRPWQSILDDPRFPRSVKEEVRARLASQTGHQEKGSSPNRRELERAVKDVLDHLRGTAETFDERAEEVRSLLSKLPEERRPAFALLTEPYRTWLGALQMDPNAAPSGDLSQPGQADGIPSCEDRKALPYLAESLNDIVGAREGFAARLCLGASAVLKLGSHIENKDLPSRIIELALGFPVDGGSESRAVAGQMGGFGFWCQVIPYLFAPSMDAVHQRALSFLGVENQQTPFSSRHPLPAGFRLVEHPFKDAPIGASLVWEGAVRFVNGVPLQGHPKSGSGEVAATDEAHLSELLRLILSTGESEEPAREIAEILQSPHRGKKGRAGHLYKAGAWIIKNIEKLVPQHDEKPAETIRKMLAKQGIPVSARWIREKIRYRRVTR